MAPSIQNLAEVVRQMLDVIPRQKFQRHGLLAIQRTEVRPLVLRDMRDDVKEMSIESLPRLNHVLPGFLLVLLGTDPKFLIVAG